MNTVAAPDALVCFDAAPIARNLESAGDGSADRPPAAGHAPRGAERRLS